MTLFIDDYSDAERERGMMVGSLIGRYSITKIVGLMMMMMMMFVVAESKRSVPILNENRSFDLSEVTSIIAVGLNYPDHAHQVANATPTSPIIFMKNRNALTVHESDVIVPLCSSNPDYEAELGVIIKDTFRDSSEENALEHVLGYTVVNDISGRCWQKNWNEACV